MAISFEMSGRGAEVESLLTLEAVQNLALSCGFVRAAVAADKPLAQRCDMPAFFKAQGVTSLSGFKSAFCETPLRAPTPGQAPPPKPAKSAASPAASAAAAAEKAAVDVTKYAGLAATWSEREWRIIPKPGGATMKPDAWYTLYAAQMQAERGDVTGEKPMWASAGGLDFDGREKWEAWKKMEGMAKEDAQRSFLVAHAKAFADTATNFRATH